MSLVVQKKRPALCGPRISGTRTFASTELVSGVGKFSDQSEQR